MQLTDYSTAKGQASSPAQHLTARVLDSSPELTLAGYLTCISTTQDMISQFDSIRVSWEQLMVKG